MFYKITFDAKTGVGIYSGTYTHQPNVQTNQALCTAAQAAAPSEWKLVSGTVVACTATDMAPPLALLVLKLDVQAKAACDYVTGQVLTAETHVAGYTNAAAWAVAAGGVPTVDPGKTAFANMATANGLNKPNFAALVLTLSASAMVLSATLTTLQSAAATATTAAQLATALTAFEASLTAEVSAINAAGVAVKAPATISIVGVNA